MFACHERELRGKRKRGEMRNTERDDAGVIGIFRCEEDTEGVADDPDGARGSLLLVRS